MIEHQTKIILSALCFVMFCVPAARASDFADKSGVYVYAGEKAEDDARLEAVEGVVQQFNFLIRPFARHRIRSRIKPYKVIDMQFAGDLLSTRFDKYPIRKTLLNGKTIRFKDTKGRDAFLTRSKKGNVVHEVGGREGNTRTSVYRFSPDGKTLFIDVSIESVRLPDAIKYRLTYRKRSSSGQVSTLTK